MILVLAGLLSVAAMLSPVSVSALAVEEAIATALVQNAELRSLRMEEEVARGQLEKAKLLSPGNPVVEGSGSRRDKPRDEGSGRYTNYGLTLSQEFEVAGQRGLRISVFEKNMARVALEIRDRERGLTYEVKNAFARALAAKKRLSLTTEVSRVHHELLDFTRVKFTAGDVSVLQVNLAEVEYSKARKDIVLARREYNEGVLALQAAMGLLPLPAITVEGEIRPEMPSLPDKALLRQMLPERPDVKAASMEAEQARTAVRLVEREIVPNIVLGGFFDRNEGRSETGGTLSVAIPLFDRKQGERIQAGARAKQAHIRQAGLERAVEREFDLDYANLLASQEELSLFVKEIIAKSSENLDLLNLAYREGKISYFDVRVAQRETFEVQFAYLDALLRAQQAINALEKSTGGAIR
jgi:outer membrane protein, heavy metal efflux system